MMMGTTKEGTNIDDLPPHKNQARTSSEKGDGRAEECNKGKNISTLRPYSQEDRFTLHHSSPRVPSSLEVSSTTTQTV